MYSVSLRVALKDAPYWDGECLIDNHHVAGSEDAPGRPALRECAQEHSEGSQFREMRGNRVEIEVPMAQVQRDPRWIRKVIGKLAKAVPVLTIYQVDPGGLTKSFPTEFGDHHAHECTLR